MPFVSCLFTLLSDCWYIISFLLTSFQLFYYFFSYLFTFCYSSFCQLYVFIKARFHRISWIKPRWQSCHDSFLYKHREQKHKNIQQKSWESRGEREKLTRFLLLFHSWLLLCRGPKGSFLPVKATFKRCSKMLRDTSL